MESECLHFDVADGVCLECGKAVLRVAVDGPDRVLTAAQVEQVRRELESWRAFCCDAGLTVGASRVDDLLALLSEGFACSDVDESGGLRDE